MATPALNIPVRASLDDFKKSMNETSSLAKSATRKVAQQFLDMNNEIAATAGAASARWALGWVGKIALVVGAFKLMGDAISATRDQLKEMVEIADKSQNLGVAPAFLQSFLTESQKLKVGVADLESALSHAFDATKDKSPIDVNEWETGADKVNNVEKALRVYNATLAKAAGVTLDGLVLFRDADTQEKKILAVLAAMVQLESIGQKAAALDLGEKMFGSQFVERIRQGKTSAESLLASMNAAAAASDAIFSNDLVLRAKAVDEQLQLAEGRLSRSLKPTFEDLAGTILTIKGYWADIVDLIARAVEVTNALGITSETARKKSELASVNEAIKNGTGIWGVPQVPEGFLGATPRADLRTRRDRLQGDIDNAERQPNVFPELPKPSRGTGGAPTKKPTDTGVDKLETAADAIEKRAAAHEAEARAIDLSASAREKNKVAAQLETVAMQANAAAGLGANVVTEEQRKRINEVAEAYGKAVDAIERARVASSISFGRQTAFLSSEDVAIAQQLRGIYGDDVPKAMASTEAAALRMNDAMHEVSQTMSSSMTSGLTDMLDGTVSVGKGFENMSMSIIRSLEQAVIKMMVVAPIMRGLQGLMGGGSELLGWGTSDFIGPMRAGGGIINGPGTSTSDSIPARLSDGEFVVRAASVSRPGVRDHLERLNAGALHFAGGGYVGSGASQPSSPSAPSFTVNLIEDASKAGKVEQNQNQTGGFDVDAYVDTIVAKKLANPGSATSQVLNQRGRLPRR